MPFPLPTGNTASFSNPPAGVNTATFTLQAGSMVIVTFQPLDLNNPGTLTMTEDDGSTVVLTMTEGGYARYDVPSTPDFGESYYFNATNGAQLVAATVPNSLR